VYFTAIVFDYDTILTPTETILTPTDTILTPTDSILTIVNFPRITYQGHDCGDSLRAVICWEVRYVLEVYAKFIICKSKYMYLLCRVCTYYVEYVLTVYNMYLQCRIYTYNVEYVLTV